MAIRKFTRLTAGAVLLAAIEVACLVAVNMALTAPAQAQWFFRDDRYPNRQRQRSGGGFFGNLFGPLESEPRHYERQPQSRQQPAPVDHSHAPPPKKVETTPTTKVVVLGDAMADWLAYGLENAFADAPEVGIVRKNRARSGLIRYEARSDLDWPHVARDILAKENPNYIVVMLGVSDRQSIRETDAERDTEQKATDTKDTKDSKDQKGEEQKSADDSDQEQAPRKSAKGAAEFRSPRWERIYIKRIDDMIAAVKSRGVPVFWVGLPAIRGTKSTSDAAYLNGLYRARAERAGVTYVDVWDGFVDDAGKFTLHGPDYEGQTRRLRSYDGAYFTTYGAIKLAHYVARDLQRAMTKRAIPVALPSGGQVSPQAPNVRPLAGPVVPLTVSSGNSDELLGGAGNRRGHADPMASRVLVKGEPVPAPPGRADDFAWPRGSDAKDKSAAPTAAPKPAAKAGPATPATAKVETAPPVESPAAKVKPAASSKAATAKSEPAPPPPPAAKARHEPRLTRSEQENAQAKPAKPARRTKPKPSAYRDDPPRPPAPIGNRGGGSNSGDLFGLFR